MTFKVLPGDLDAYARQLGRAADDAAQARQYLSGYAGLGGWNGALIMIAGPPAVDSLNAAIEACDKLAGVLSGSGQGVTASANYYRATDVDAAARIDATLSGICVAGTALEEAWAANPCGPGFADSREPYTRLKPVEDVEYSHPLGFLDNISMTHWALEAADKIIGCNPLNKALDHFLGDWQSFAKAGKALANAADSLDDLAYNVQGGAIALHSTWDGQAADSAYQHFTRLAADIQGLAGPMREAAKQFEQISHGVWSSCEAVSGLIKGLGDALTIAGIAAVAGTVTAETGVGAVVGYGIAAWQVVEILDMWGQATKAMAYIYGAVQGGVGLIEAQTSMLRQTSLPQISADGAYRHPIAAQ
ncbi:hypothetical protein QLQ12_24105 [Actinoplanes sp. NEAU-A12]|uniref:WXG100 family type VII secretion target n=1 Tax=Actinoplanes sandaracinus TaxID=3045177 RepID=A0ABT6WPR0_9ACTN|nr:hypothetical protein [Actinoplanes sandaracinus]MDI6101709.1 hypothetical protein [Actinoplanes sandaracinus]